MKRADGPSGFGPTIHELIATRALAAPSAPAVLDAGVTMTFGELDARAERLAAELRARGVGAESRVGVVVPRSADAVVAFLGVLKAGAAYVPLDPAYPAERRLFMLDNSGVQVLVTVSSVGRLPEFGTVQLVVLDALPDQAPDPAQAAEVSAACAAYVIYTSGSTGTPKGVVVEHRNVVALARNDDRLAIRPGETVAQFAPTAFDASVFEMWAALCRGAQVAILSSVEVSVAELGAQLRELRPDWLFLTTGLFHLLADFDLAAFESVGTLLTGGDVLNPDRVAAAAATTRAHAAYGPTETTVFTSLHAAAPVPDPAGQKVPLGSPLSGVRVHVLDERLEPVPDGEIGELWIGGCGVSRGYHERPALTAEKFLPDPDAPGGRMYGTGDLGCVLPTGELEFHGRIDRQVKVRGFRVELGEIESALLSAPGVASAAVVSVPGADGDKRLAGYVAPADGSDLAVSELRAWLSERLPAYTVPSTVRVLDQLPLDANGKLDRKALPAAWSNRDDIQGLPEYQEPGSEIERLISTAWADALELDRVGAVDKFFALGGDSLRSVTVLERLRAMGIRFTAAEFFSHPTVAGLAALQSESGERAGTPVAVR